MNILSIDTTTKKASVALTNGVKFFDITEENEITHSEKLLPLIDLALAEDKLKIEDIDLYAVINGPGSFTGVRIGLATVKAFAMVNNKKIFAISALEAIAFSVFVNNKTDNEKYILSLIDAKNNRCYYGLFKVSKVNDKIDIKSIIKPENDLIENLPEIIYNSLPDKATVLIAGNVKNDITKQYFTNEDYIYTYPTTREVIFAYRKINNLQNYIFDTYTLDAEYVRPSQAERLKNEHSKK